jgi:hypothetical protein
MGKAFQVGEPVYVDAADGPVHLRGVTDHVSRDDGGETVELALLGAVPRAYVRRERRTKQKRPWKRLPSAPHVPPPAS